MEDNFPLLLILFLLLTAVLEINSMIVSPLHVEGNKIVDSSGNTIILKGVAIADPYKLWADGRWSKLEEDIKEIAINWNANIIRVPVHPQHWTNNPSYTEDYLDPVVNLAEKYNLYVLIDWHAIGNPHDYRDDETNPEEHIAAEAWKKIANKYKDRSSVIYELYNEPAFIEWDDWKLHAERLIDVIREEDPDALIFVGGVDWAYDLRGVANNPINRTNIVYTTHPYPGKPLPWDEYFGFVTEKYPVFVSEFGFDKNSDDENLRGTSEGYGIPLLNYMESKGIGYTAWIFIPYWTPPLVEDDWGTPTEFGQLIKEDLTNFEVKSFH